MCTGRDIDERQWVDPEVQALCDISPDELALLTDPVGFDRPDEPVAQPPFDASKPSLHYPAPVRDAIMGMSDSIMWETMSVPEPPVSLD